MVKGIPVTLEVYTLTRRLHGVPRDQAGAEFERYANDYYFPPINTERRVKVERDLAEILRLE